MKKWLLLVAMLLCLSVGGCVEGETDGQVRLDSEVAEQIEDVGEGAVSILTALSSLLPWLIPFATGGGGLLAMYKRLKPKLTRAEVDKTNLAWGGEVLAEVLESVKVDYPDIWKNIGPGLRDVIKTSALLENTIRDFRHLAPKE